MKRLLLLAACALAACSNQPDQPANNMIVVGEETGPPTENAIMPPPVSPPRPEANNAVAPPRPETNDAVAEREVVSEAPFTPQSAQGAANVVQTYFALVEAKKFAQAKALWGPNAAQAPNLASYREYHAEVYKPGRIEGAAGSLYVTVPVKAYGVTGKGEKFEEPQVVTLRRVNDVDGSTAEQRRWHITKIDSPPNEN